MEQIDQMDQMDQMGDMSKNNNDENIYNANNVNTNNPNANANIFMGKNMQESLIMLVTPIIATLFSTLFQSFITDLKSILYKLFLYLNNAIFKMMNKKLFKMNEEINELHIPLSVTQSTYGNIIEDITQEGLPIIWYINTYIDDNKIKIAKLYEHPESSKKMSPTYISPFGRDGMGLTSQNTKNNKQHDALFLPIGKRSNYVANNLGTNDKNNQNHALSQKDFGQELEHLPEITDGIYIDFVVESTNSQPPIGRSTNILILKSKKKSLNEIGKFYQKVKEDYENIMSDKGGKLYIYNGEKAIPQYGCYALDKSQSFDNIFLENKNNIIRDIVNMEDKEYYKKYGMKRKLGHLYVGPPGSGKTCFVTALAKFTGRSVVYIPISRITNNAELQSIIYDRKYNNVTYNMDEVIFIADELDSLNSSNLLKKKQTNDNDNDNNNNNNNSQQYQQYQQPNLQSSTVVINNGDKNKETTFKFDQEFDKLNIGMVLNILDGNNDQDGMIFIGTANNYDKLDPAIYRNGRMELIKFNYMGRNEIANMIEHYYDTKLTDDQILKIKDDRTVQSLSLKNVCLKYIQKKKQNDITIDKLIDEINYMFDHLDESNDKLNKPNLSTLVNENKKLDNNNNNNNKMSRVPGMAIHFPCSLPDDDF